MLDGITTFQLIQLAGLLIGLGGGFGYLKSQVNQMNNNLARLEKDQDTLEQRLVQHIEESTKAREDIAELKADVKHIGTGIQDIKRALESQSGG